MLVPRLFRVFAGRTFYIVVFVTKSLNDAPIAIIVVCFSRLLTSMANSVDPDQTAPMSTLFASNLVRQFLQQTTSADDIFRCIFDLAL